MGVVRGPSHRNTEVSRRGHEPAAISLLSHPPAGFCETTKSCTVDFSIFVQVPGLVELPAPSKVFPGNNQPIPYVRCGLMTACTGTEDVPYNWSTHPWVHWGTPQTVDAIVDFAETWYQTCSTKVSDPSTGNMTIVVPQNLAINDISLPLGGLLDVANDWEPTYSGQSGGHISHRNGVDIDLVQVSVPSDPSICGTRPTKGTRDDKWKNTRLWRKKQEILFGTKLRALRDDPGHLRWEVTNP